VAVHRAVSRLVLGDGGDPLAQAVADVLLGRLRERNVDNLVGYPGQRIASAAPIAWASESRPRRGSEAGRHSRQTRWWRLCVHRIRLVPISPRTSSRSSAWPVRRSPSARGREPSVNDP